MSNHNMFYGELSETIIQCSSNNHLNICGTGVGMWVVLSRVDLVWVGRVRVCGQSTG